MPNYTLWIAVIILGIIGYMYTTTPEMTAQEVINFNETRMEKDCYGDHYDACVNYYESLNKKYE